MIRVLIADDHPVVRRGLQEILGSETGFSVAGEAHNGAEAIELVRKQKFDVVLLDITMPGRSGLDVLKEIKQDFPRLPVLILSIHPEDQYAVRSLKAGADGYLTKESAPEELIKAIRKVMQGGKYVSASLAENLAFQLEAKTHRAPHETLSDREYQIFCLIASGKGLTEIGEDLSLSVKTISTYRTRILEKFGMKNNAELTRYALEHQLLP
ncbi:MAG: response regulator transcription factor [bacterium]